MFLYLAALRQALLVAKALEVIQRRHGHVSERPWESNRACDADFGKRCLNISVKRLVLGNHMPRGSVTAGLRPQKGRNGISEYTISN